MAEQTVNIVNMAFNPDSLSIAPGDTVKWVWGEGGHSTTSDDGLWDSGVKSAGSTFSRAFPDAGNFPYHCSRHPGMMTATINVGSQSSQ